ncbi:nuclear pore complex protein DDB_G0274915-like isoform X2 [Salmo trutta]|uniref:nuclear pore complex protein DDB_G0274915-like isoform X2 n=1 Tax=Salmo trutta TaxID=8032 RepID=UPI001131763B|nr:nuclear pore complex protein DDB_G0274915-like isoform X2 [Salmo trutta]
MSSKMSASISLEQDLFNCPICLDLLKDPVTMPCGHSHCMGCIQGLWEQEDQIGGQICPQCKESLTQPWPTLNRNTILAEMVAKLKKTELQAAPLTEDVVACDFCTRGANQAVKSCLVCLASYCETHLKPHYENPAFGRHTLLDATRRLQERVCSTHHKLLEIYCRTDKLCVCVSCALYDHKGHVTVPASAERMEKQKETEATGGSCRQKVKEKEEEAEHLRGALMLFKRSAREAVLASTRTLSELKVYLERRGNEVKELIRAQEKVEVNRAEAQLQRLEQEIIALKKRDSELKKLTLTQDDAYFLQHYQDPSSSPVSEDLPSVNIDPLCDFGTVKRAYTHFKEQLECFCDGGMKRILNTVKAIHMLQSPKPSQSPKTIGQANGSPPAFKPALVMGEPTVTCNTPLSLCTKSSILKYSSMSKPPTGTAILFTKKGPSNDTKPAARVEAILAKPLSTTDNLLLTKSASNMNINPLLTKSLSNTEGFTKPASGAGIAVLNTEPAPTTSSSIFNCPVGVCGKPAVDVDDFCKAALNTDSGPFTKLVSDNNSREKHSTGFSFGKPKCNTGSALFGKPESNTGSALFGKPESNTGLSLFGKPESSTGSALFGKPESNTGLSLLGKPESNTGFSFGKPESSTGLSLFGKPESNTGLSPFGKPESNTGFSFGKPESSTGLSLLGKPESNTGFSFGKPESSTGLSLFGKPESSTGLSLFGKPESSTGLSLFGKPESSTGLSLFGKPESSTGLSLFGKPESSTGLSLFGKPESNTGFSFGKPESSTGLSLFGKPESSTGLSLFGKPESSTGLSLFGKPESSTGLSLFGKPESSTGLSLFGKPESSTGLSLFGKPESNTGFSFGKPESSTGLSLFGKPESSTGLSLFGKPESSTGLSLFGKPESSTGLSLFGKPESSTGLSLFGKPESSTGLSLFGKPESNTGFSFGKPESSTGLSLFGKPESSTGLSLFGKPESSTGLSLFGKPESSTGLSLFGKPESSTGLSLFGKPESNTGFSFGKPESSTGLSLFGKPESNTGFSFGKPESSTGSPLFGKPESKTGSSFGKPADQPGVVEISILEN